MPDAAAPFYILKVQLAYISPPIWRRLRVRGDMSLQSLHRVIQRAMPWQDHHLHQFRVGDLAYGPPDREFGQDIRSERLTSLRQIAPLAGTRFAYEYDFGDGWEHEIVVEKILPADSTARCPECLDGARACPPEDCGGFPGYERLLAVLHDPAHPDHEDLKDWAGGAFDPEAFDVEAINRRLKRLRSLI